MRVILNSILTLCWLFSVSQLQAQKQFASADEAKAYFDSFLKVSILKATDPLITKYSALPDAKGLKLNLQEVQCVVNANVACLLFPIVNERLPMPDLFKGTINPANFFMVVYETKNTRSVKTGMVYSAVKLASKGLRPGVINHEEGYIMVVPNVPNQQGAAEGLAVSYSTGSKVVKSPDNAPVAYKFSGCLNDMYSGVGGTIAGVAGGSCASGNIFGCGFSAGYALGSVVGCGVLSWW